MEVIIIEKEYQIAFREVIEVLKYIPQDDYEKIPDDVIEVMEAYQDKTYDFKIDVNKEFKEQNISDMAKAILSNFYRDYWVSEGAKQEIINLENMQRIKLELEKKRKYNPNDIFKRKE